MKATPTTTGLGIIGTAVVFCVLGYFYRDTQIHRDKVASGEYIPPSPEETREMVKAEPKAPGSRW